MAAAAPAVSSAGVVDGPLGTPPLEMVRLVRGAAAQVPVSESQWATALGTWRGTSVCLVHPSSCRDEIVVYRITPKSGRDSVAFDARKIVRGQEEEMGVLTCRVTRAVSPL